MSARCIASVLLLVGCAGDTGEPPPPAPEPYIAERGPPMAPAPLEIPWLAADGTADLGLTPPIEPAPDRMLPCPAGWVETTTDDGDMICEPWGPDGRPTCADGEVAFPGEACAVLGRVCPVGEFPDDADLPPGPKLFVRSGATGGDGTRALPLGTIADAVAMATSGAVVVVGEGRWDEPIERGADLLIDGVCVARTVLTSTSALPVVSVTGGSIALSNLAIDGPVGSAATVSGGTLALSGVAVTDAFSVAVDVSGGLLRTDGVLVRATREDPTGDGIALRLSGGRAELSRFISDVNVGAAIDARGAVELSLDATLLLATDSSTASGVSGAGVLAEGGATVTIAGSVLEGNHSAAIVAMGAGTSLTLDGTLISESVMSAGVANGMAVDLREGASGILRMLRVDGGAAAGVSVTGAASADVADSRIEGTRRNGVIITDAGSSLALTDTVIRGVSSVGRAVPNGHGLRVLDTMDVSVARVRIDGCQTAGLSVDGVSLEIEDLVVEGTRTREAGDDFGQGVDVLNGGQLTLRRARIARNHGTGIYATASSGFVGEELRVDETLGRTLEDPIGFGLVVDEESTFALRRAHLAGNHRVGIGVSEGTSGTLEDVLVQDTASSTDGLWGIGIEVNAASLTLSRVVVDGSHTRGMNLLDGSVIEASDLVVSNTQPQRLDGVGGQGINIFGDVVFTGSRVELRSNHFFGFLAQEGSLVDLADIVIEDTLPEEATGAFGPALALYGGADGVVRRAELLRSHTVAMFASTGATLTVQDLVVDGVAATECTEGFCGGGTGVASYAAAVVSITRFSVSNTTLCGMQVGNLGVLTVFSGEVRDNPIGICIQVPNYDLGRFRNEVDFRNNARAVESTTLLVPDTMVPGG